MKALRLCMLLALLGGCATIERPRPLTSDEMIALSKSGLDSPRIIEELKRTETVLPLTASDIVRLHEAGVPDAVLDHLQRAQIDEIRWRDRHSNLYWYGYGPLYRGFGTCPWPSLRPNLPGTRLGFWGC